MKRIQFAIKVSVLSLLVLGGCVQPSVNRDTVFQTSTISALLQGVYDGDLTCGELRRHGDFGIGTFNCLDGEMVGLGGEFYQVRSDGRAYPVCGSMKTPFAVVTYFEPDMSVELNQPVNYIELERYLDGLLPTENIFYAIRLDGVFSYIKARSVPRQNKPYPPLVEVVKDQPTFEFKDVQGTMVGFRCPDFVEGINVPGYHLHFITADRSGGGHVLDCKVRRAKIGIDHTSNFYMVLPESAEFYRADLAGKEPAELEKVEK